MSKKRRTRAQKNRAAQRRQKRDKTKAAPKVERLEESPDKELKPVSPTAGRQRIIVSNVRPSLVLLMLLIIFQLSLWLAFRFSGLDESLFELIKL